MTDLETKLAALMESYKSRWVAHGLQILPLLLRHAAAIGAAQRQAEIAAHLDDTASTYVDFNTAVHCKVLAEAVRQLPMGAGKAP